VTKSQGEWAIFGVCYHVDNALYSIAFWFGTHTKTAEPIEMPFGLKTRMGPGKLREPCIRWGCRSPKGKGEFSGLSRPFKSIGNLRSSVRIIQSPIMSCNRRDHWACPASANNILKISGRTRCGLLSAKGVVGLYSAGEVWYLRLIEFKVLCPTWHKIGHFGDVLPSQSVGLVLKNWNKHNKSKHNSVTKYTTT